MFFVFVMCLIVILYSMYVHFDTHKRIDEIYDEIDDLEADFIQRLINELGETEAIIDDLKIDYDKRHEYILERLKNFSRFKDEADMSLQSHSSPKDIHR